MARQAVTPGALYRVLSEQFRERRAYECLCRMPLPFVVQRPDIDSANWRLGAPVACEKGCDRIIGQIAVQLWSQFDLVEPVASESPAAPIKTE